MTTIHAEIDESAFVRVGVAEKDFEGAFVVNGWHNGCTDLNGFCGCVRYVNYR
jgi:hypothetical protein